MVIQIDGFAEVAHHPAADGFEEVERFSVLLVVADGEIPSQHPHVAFLPFAGVPIGAIVAIAIAVTVLMPGVSSEQENQRAVAGGANPSLPLTSVSRVQLSPAVDLTDNELCKRRDVDQQKTPTAASSCLVCLDLEAAYMVNLLFDKR